MFAPENEVKRKRGGGKQEAAFHFACVNIRIRTRALTRPHSHMFAPYGAASEALLFCMPWTPTIYWNFVKNRIYSPPSILRHVKNVYHKMTSWGRHSIFHAFVIPVTSCIAIHQRINNEIFFSGFKLRMQRKKLIKDEWFNLTLSKTVLFRRV